MVAAEPDIVASARIANRGFRRLRARVHLADGELSRGRDEVAIDISFVFIEAAIIP